MKTRRLLILIVLSVTCSYSLNAQVKINHRHFYELFNSKKYDQLFSEAYRIRNSDEYGKNWMLDYYMAMALCGKGNRNLAEQGFSYIEHEYDLHPEQKVLLERGRQFCSQSSISPTQNQMLVNLIFSNSTAAGNPVSFVRGKIGLVADCKSNKGEYKFNPLFDQSQLQNRLFGIDKKDSALKYYRSFLPAVKYNINSSGRYIIVTRAPLDLQNNEVEGTVKELEKIYQFMVNRYNVRPPDFLITVYLMGNTMNLREVAEVTHHLTIPSNSYGYSCLADLSVLGNSSKTGLGTIKHELFHLIIRTDIGDIPGWLDEGIACLYEESHWEGDTLKYDKNLWRTTVLKDNSKSDNPLPLLRTIFNNNWDEFTSNNTTTICELSVNYALAKHFAMFLEDKGKLPLVVEAFKKRRNLFVDTTLININSVQVMEEALNQNLSDTQQEFDKWLFTKYKISVHREKFAIMEWIDKLMVIQFMCRNEPEAVSFMKNYKELRDELDKTGLIIPDELFEKSVKLIAQGQKLYLYCKDKYE
jgi:hypothetical protein